MKRVKSIQAAKSGAAEALRSTLRQVSQIKVKQIDFETARPDLCVDIMALIEVHGKSHTLACKVEASGRPDHVRTALAALCSDTAVLDGNATPVLIAPCASDEAMAMCSESRAGFLDLEGNARLHVGELFIGKRSMPSKQSSARLAGAA